MNQWTKTEAQKYDDAYEKGYFPTNAVNYFEEDICKFIQKTITGPIRLLDIGCGPCFTRDIGIQYGIDVYGLDITQNLINYWSPLKIKAAVGSSSSIPYKDNTFDVVMMWDVLEHIPVEGLEDTFYEVKRVAKKNGLFDFIICLTEEKRKFDGMNFHVTVKPWIWWFNLMAHIIGQAPKNLSYLDKNQTHYCGKILIEK